MKWIIIIGLILLIGCNQQIEYPDSVNITGGNVWNNITFGNYLIYPTYGIFENDSVCTMIYNDEIAWEGKCNRILVNKTIHLMFIR